MVSIRKYEERDKEEIWKIIEYVISNGDSFTYALNTSREFALEDWCSPDKHTFVAVDKNESILGTYYIKPNQTGLGSHVANGSYMVASDARRKGIGRLMGEHSIEQARKLGFLAMQFNFVVKSNEKAVNLWKSLGFEIIGEIPDAYRHIDHGLTNAYIMYRKL
ncbi:MAG: GNAT family N-acetyltransferase [Pyrinomonadaceae bacterium]|nr:GNAT family N-acetyltransferase [Pyrinomonadaceae bacterium]